jgi:Putative auto-transporter adhesin, head GIN domain
MNARGTISILAIAAFTAGTLVGCSINGGGPWINRAELTGETTTQTRSVDGFTGIALSGNAHLTVTQGNSFSVAVTADSGLQNHIDTSVRGSTLEIDQNYSIAGSSPDVAVTVTMPHLTYLEVSGSSSTTATKVHGDSLHVSSSGSSDIRIDAQVQELAVDVAGSGDLALTGTAGSAAITVSGSGTVSGSTLATATAHVSVSGSGDVTLRVATTLDANVAGSGSINYCGDPVVDSDVSGSGSIRRAGS